MLGSDRQIWAFRPGSDEFILSRARKYLAALHHPIRGVLLFYTFRFTLASTGGVAQSVRARDS